MQATFFKAFIDGKTRYIPVVSIKQVVVEDAAGSKVRLVTEKGDHNLQGDDAAAAIATRLLSGAPAEPAGPLPAG